LFVVFKLTNSIKTIYEVRKWLTINCGYKHICWLTSLFLVVCRRDHVLFTLFVFVCVLWCPTNIVLCFCFVLCCQFLWIVHFWLSLRCSLTFIYLGLPRKVECWLANSRFQCKEWEKYNFYWLTVKGLRYDFFLSDPSIMFDPAFAKFITIFCWNKNGRRLL
jgi:hypothetical protein